MEALPIPVSYHLQGISETGTLLVETFTSGTTLIPSGTTLEVFKDQQDPLAPRELTLLFPDLLDLQVSSLSQMELLQQILRLEMLGLTATPEKSLSTTMDFGSKPVLLQSVLLGR